jgi:hypothetical protein
MCTLIASIAWTNQTAMEHEHITHVAGPRSMALWSGRLGGVLLHQATTVGLGRAMGLKERRKGVRLLQPDRGGLLDGVGELELGAALERSRYRHPTQRFQIKPSTVWPLHRQPSDKSRRGASSPKSLAWRFVFAVEASSRSLALHELCLTYAGCDFSPRHTASIRGSELNRASSSRALAGSFSCSICASSLFAALLTASGTQVGKAVVRARPV